MASPKPTRALYPTAGTELEEQLRQFSLAATGQLPAAAVQQAVEEGRISVAMEQRLAGGQTWQEQIGKRGPGG